MTLYNYYTVIIVLQCMSNAFQGLMRVAQYPAVYDSYFLGYCTKYWNIRRACQIRLSRRSNQCSDGGIHHTSDGNNRYGYYLQ
jgi:hypothetical protein